MEATGSIWTRPQKQHSRGPDPTYSREQITKAAIKIADADGLEAVTMRRIAREVSAGAMSLYRYIGSKDDLMELMVDAVQAEDPLPDKPSGDWRADLTELAERGRAMMFRHPWTTVVSTTRPSFGPNSLRIFEYSLSCVDGLGLSIDEMLAIVLNLIGYVRSFVQNALAEAETLRRTKMTEDQWRTTQGPYLQQIIDSGQYPLFTKVIIEAALPHLDPDRAFRFGLDNLLDGIAAKLERQR
jgi:AcrR family transcriptional regulator